MGGHPTQPLSSRCREAAGAALGVVLWALVAMGALALAAALSARVETALAHNYRDHAAALALAEAGLADALAREAAEPGPAGVERAAAGTLETGEWTARWTPRAGRFAVRAEGRSGRATRVVEAWVERGGVLSPRVVAWREVR
jgi:Tfp pilus assembly protein PilX